MKRILKDFNFCTILSSKTKDGENWPKIKVRWQNALNDSCFKKYTFEWVKLDWLLENKVVKCQFWHGMWQWDLESLFSISRSDKLNFWPRKILCYISISVPLCTQKPSAALQKKKKKKLISMSMEFMNSSVLSILITHSFWHLLKRFSLEKVTKLNYILMSWWIHFWL